MKYTLLVTQRCNLACSYCYVGQQPASMSPEVAGKIVEFAYRNTPPHERIEVGFFGGEPLLEFGLVRRITELFEQHREFDPCRVLFTVVTNGTVFTPEIAEFVNAHEMGFGISCDGAPEVHDRFRVFHNGRGSSRRVERTIRAALESFSAVMVNAVYGPRSLSALPRTVEYFSSLGVRQIYLNPDFTAQWQPADLARLAAVYGEVGRLYLDYYRGRDPHFISLIDGKISVLLRDGYSPLERCRMGRGEFAFTPAGKIYPCERLVGDGNDGHCLGSLEEGIRVERMLCRQAPGDELNRECQSCGLRTYCMNWCGCSNYFTAGYYNRVSPFLCASEKAAIEVSLNVFQTLEQELGGTFFEHLAGSPMANSLLSSGGTTA